MTQIITALEEGRVAICDDITGAIINVIVADSVAWVQANVCKAGQTAYDVKGLPVSHGWSSEPGDDGEWYIDEVTIDPETDEQVVTRQLIEYEGDGVTPKVDPATGWAATITIPVT